jgi:hypothetical protein
MIEAAEQCGAFAVYSCPFGLRRIGTNPMTTATFFRPLHDPLGLGLKPARTRLVPSPFPGFAGSIVQVAGCRPGSARSYCSALYGRAANRGRHSTLDLMEDSSYISASGSAVPDKQDGTVATDHPLKPSVKRRGLLLF